MAPTIPIIPSTPRQIYNTIICLTSFFFIFRYFRRYVSFYPLTIESIWQITLAEINRRKNIERVKRLENTISHEDVEKGVREKGDVAVRCMASVVGYREEEGLYRRCLQSYRTSPGLEIMLVGIDGDEEGDMEMVAIAQEVFPDLLKIHLDEPYGPLAVRISQNYINRELYNEKSSTSKWKWNPNDPDHVPPELLAEAHQYAFRTVYNQAISTLRENGILDPIHSTATSNSGKPKSLKAICFYQPHKCKKDIMFTNMVFSLALGHANDIEYLWTSDSDTLVFPDTLYQTIGCMSADPLIGGSCSALSIHNDEENAIAALGSAAYWSELTITRGQTGAVDAVDCQPGPCAAFRLLALEPILLRWYTQTSIGYRTIVNEDRHLTTNLLLQNWKVTFNTSAIAATDTPTTLLRWLLQQQRWARATHIETFQYPQVYSIHGEILFVTAIRRFYGPLVIGVFTIRYVLTGYTQTTYSLLDLMTRVALCTIYNYACNKGNVKSIWYLVASQVFYQIPLPGIMAWSVLTVLEGGWGTSMRSEGEMAAAALGTGSGMGDGLGEGMKEEGRRKWWGNVWSSACVVLWMGFVGAAVARWVVGRVAPVLIGECMALVGVGTMASLWYALLG